MDDEIQAFVAERNAMLLRCDVDEMMAFFKKHNPRAPLFPSRETAEITLHKARTAALGLPLQERQKSKDWLRARGYQSLDDGDLP